MCLLSNDIHDYYNVAQGKITIPNVDDGEECTLTDVSLLGDVFARNFCVNKTAMKDKYLLIVTLYCKIQTEVQFTIKLSSNGI